MSYIHEYSTSFAGMLGDDLRHFSTRELMLGPTETRVVLRFFWPGRARQIRTTTITEQLRDLAQGLVVEAIRGSSQLDVNLVGSRETPRSVADIVARVAARALEENWLRRDQIVRRIYESVRATLANNHRSAFATLLLQPELQTLNQRGL